MVGILFALVACFIWGLIYVIPMFISGFSPIEVALGRYVFFGSLSVIVYTIYRIRGNFTPASWEAWRIAFCIALFGNVIFYMGVVGGVHYAGADITSLIVGLSPICISLYGNWLQKECDSRSLIIPSLLTLAGLVLVNLSAFLVASSAKTYFIGLLAAIYALVSWSWYVVANSRYLKKNQTIQATQWVSMIGTCTFFSILVLVPVRIFQKGADSMDKFLSPSPELNSFLLGCLILGVVCAWGGTYFWSLASARLPVYLMGQLSIFETIFALVFIFFIELRLPSLEETAGIIAMLSGIYMTITSVQASQAEKA